MLKAKYVEMPNQETFKSVIHSFKFDFLKYENLCHLEVIWVL